MGKNRKSQQPKKYNQSSDDAMKFAAANRPIVELENNYEGINLPADNQRRVGLEGDQLPIEASLNPSKENLEISTESESESESEDNYKGITADDQGRVADDQGRVGLEGDQLPIEPVLAFDGNNKKQSSSNKAAVAIALSTACAAMVGVQLSGVTPREAYDMAGEVSSTILETGNNVLQTIGDNLNTLSADFQGSNSNITTGMTTGNANIPFLDNTTYTTSIIDTLPPVENSSINGTSPNPNFVEDINPTSPATHNNNPLIEDINPTSPATHNNNPLIDDNNNSLLKGGSSVNETSHNLNYGTSPNPNFVEDINPTSPALLNDEQSSSWGKSFGGVTSGVTSFIGGCYQKVAGMLDYTETAVTDTDNTINTATAAFTGTTSATVENTVNTATAFTGTTNITVENTVNTVNTATAFNENVLQLSTNNTVTCPLSDSPDNNYTSLLPNDVGTLVAIAAVGITVVGAGTYLYNKCKSKNKAVESSQTTESNDLTQEEEETAAVVNPSMATVDAPQEEKTATTVEKSTADVVPKTKTSSSNITAYDIIHNTQLKQNASSSLDILKTCWGTDISESNPAGGYFVA